MKRLVIRLSLLSVVVVPGLIAIAQARYGSEQKSPPSSAEPATAVSEGAPEPIRLAANRHERQARPRETPCATRSNSTNPVCLHGWAICQRAMPRLAGWMKFRPPALSCSPRLRLASRAPIRASCTRRNTKPKEHRPASPFQRTICRSNHGAFSRSSTPGRSKNMKRRSRNSPTIARCNRYRTKTATRSRLALSRRSPPPMAVGWPPPSNFAR